MRRARRPKKMVDVCSGLLPFLESWKLAGGQVPKSYEQRYTYWVVFDSGFKTIVFYCHKATAPTSQALGRQPQPEATGTDHTRSQQPKGPQPCLKECRKTL